MHASYVTHVTRSLLVRSTMLFALMRCWHACETRSSCCAAVFSLIIQHVLWLLLRNSLQALMHLHVCSPCLWPAQAGGSQGRGSQVRRLVGGGRAPLRREKHPASPCYACLTAPQWRWLAHIWVGLGQGVGCCTAIKGSRVGLPVHHSARAASALNAVIVMNTLNPDHALD